MYDERPTTEQPPTEPEVPATVPAGQSDERGRADLGEAWRRAGAALGSSGGGVGESVRQAWETAGREPEPDAPADSLRRLADVVERSVTTARSAASSPEARDRLGAGAREANDAIERAVRLSLAELGRSLQRLEPKDEDTSDRR